MATRPVVQALAIAGAALLGPLLCTAHDTQPVPEGRPAADDGLTWLASRIAAMDSDDLAVREAAARQVRSDDRVNLVLLESFLAGAEVSPSSLSLEQRERVTKMALSLFRGEPRGALGISFARFDAAEGVEIAGTVGNFDAARVLKPGDTMRTMDGLPVRFNNEARAIILSHDPGDIISIEFTRRGEVRVAEVRLGSFHELRNAMEPDDLVLAAAWDLRCARRGGHRATELPRVLDPGVSADRWLDLTRTERARSRMMWQQGNVRTWNVARAETIPAGVAGGGEARGVPAMADPDFLARDGSSPEIENLIAQISDLSGRIRNSEARFRVPGLPAQQRQNIQNQIESDRSARMALRKKLDLLRQAEVQKHR
ncbi:hypothetical protein PHYC_02543 [Phycisphaerales bacterium]|nr:hypothetical protein PHYC_02543 [Phycisphaerales bacterium]